MSCLLQHYRYCAFSSTPLEYSVIPLCHGGSVALYQHDRPLHIPQQFINEVDVGLGQLIAMVLSLDVSWFDQPTSSPLSSLQDELSSMPLQVHAMQQVGKGRVIFSAFMPLGQINSTHTTKVKCSTYSPRGCSWRGVYQLPCSHAPRASSPACYRWQEVRRESIFPLTMLPHGR